MWSAAKKFSAHGVNGVYQIRARKMDMTNVLLLLLQAYDWSKMFVFSWNAFMMRMTFHSKMCIICALNFYVIQCTFFCGALSIFVGWLCCDNFHFCSITL